MALNPDRSGQPSGRHCITTQDLVSNILFNGNWQVERSRFSKKIKNNQQNSVYKPQGSFPIHFILKHLAFFYQPKKRSHCPLSFIFCFKKIKFQILHLQNQRTCQGDRHLRNLIQKDYFLLYTEQQHYKFNHFCIKQKGHMIHLVRNDFFLADKTFPQICHLFQITACMNANTESHFPH